MKIVPQITLFDYSEIENLGDLERCKLLIENVPDEIIINKLTEIGGKGRNDMFFKRKRNKTNNRY